MKEVSVIEFYFWWDIIENDEKDKDEDIDLDYFMDFDKLDED